MYLRQMLINSQIKLLESKSRFESNESYSFFISHSHNVKTRMLLIRSLSNLKQIFISDLQFNLTHKRTCLKLKNIMEAGKMTAIQILCEDDKMDLVRVSVYNFNIPKNKKYDDIFYVGRTFYVIEPFFKIANDGLPVIRIDEPNEVIFEEEILANQKASVRELKEWGSVAFGAEDYVRAIFYFDAAIEKMDKQIPDKELLAILHSNKANCLNLIGQYELAIDAAVTSLQLNPSYSKARYNLAKILMFCNRLAEASNEIDTLLSSGKNLDVLALKKKLDQFTKNQKEIFDWSAIIDCVLNNQKAEVADYINPKLQVRKTQIMGLGVFATQSIAKGELLAVIKPFSLATSTDVNMKLGPNSFQMNSSKNILYDPYHNILESKIITLCSKNPYKMNEILQLCNKSTLALTLEERKEKAKKCEEIATEFIRSVISNNAFGGIDMEHALKTGDHLRENTGIWIFPSFFNHSCDPNAIWWTLENLFIIFSAKAISADQEFFISYFPKDLRIEDRRNMMTKFGFVCKCLRCQRDEASPNKKLFEMLDSLNPQSKNYRNRQKQLIKELKLIAEKGSLWERNEIFKHYFSLLMSTCQGEKAAEFIIDLYKFTIKQSYSDMPFCWYFY